MVSAAIPSQFVNEPVGFLSGQWVPAARLAIPIWDSGFVQGATVADQLRTFQGRLFRLEDHLQRLFRSLEIVQVDAGVDQSELARIVTTIVDHNRRFQDAGDDLGLGILVTPGVYPTLARWAAAMPAKEPAAEGVESPGPIVCVYTYPLPFALWAEKYTSGETLLTSEIRQVPAECWPAELKCRSRMHYFLADRRARSIDPQARAVLLDQAGNLSECSTANVVLYLRNEGLVSPPRSQILPGISLMHLAELAGLLGIPFIERAIPGREMDQADEILLTSTSACILPVVRLDGRPVGNGRSGPVFERLLGAWSGQVGVDIARQAQRFSPR